ncbi:DNA repair protein RecO [Salegentibacter maritimus]|uniref:DNA repair protein RecO n=1 Tax=Salegentibacter maritimus TaxID=2794347 RepID=A0ABS0TJH2_9FLAO|nr:DNA repair protein RecO [Salegentibacter maritimus]MBI6120777.1 DNA repair protein RecO [Salegentibacter maritimus]
MLVTTPAIIISALKYGEADLIVKAYTYSDGLKTYMLKGVLKSKKGKFKASQFQLLTQLEIVARHRNQGKMEYLKEAKVKHTYTSLHTNMVKGAMLMFLAEVLKNAIREEEANRELFEYLETSLMWLDLHDQIANFHLLFLLNLTRYLGFYPDADARELDYFNLLEGVFEWNSVNNYCIDGQNVAVLRQLLGIHFDDLNTLKLNQQTRANFLNMLLLYYGLHIEGFKKPKSLAVLNEIFS